ncbi:MAG: M1 family metallopeptidase [Candidatus Micrarchaeota archaeon]|nr:M1 family metallopeptidase [Candidatus Micrarchaeota archaeon]
METPLDSMPSDKHKTLGNNVVPINYKLVFTPDFKKFKTTVYEDISCKVKKPTRSIKINAKELQFVSASVFANGKVQRAKIKLDEKEQTATFTFARPVGGKIELAMTSICDNNERMYGFYKSKYSHGGSDGYILTSQFEAPNARAAFPCFDEPEFKATFDVSFIIDEKYDAISNMPIKEESKLEDRKKMVRFEKSAKMSTYLLYLFVGNYESISGSLGDLRLRAITVPGKKEYARLSLQYAKKLLDWQQKYFGINFPLPKLDFIGIPDFAAGAMENWGAITFRELQFMITKDSSVAMKQLASETISHEIVHQWFGDLVTMKWWNDLWLNESFATFLACKAIDEVFPEWDFETQYVDETLGSAFSADALKSTHPISVHVDEPAQIDSIFDRISYEKGGSMLYMLEDYVGKKIFRKGLHHYLSTFAYSNAEKEDLWNSIQIEARKEGKRLIVPKLMNSWLTKAGHPIVNVEKAKGGFLLSQKRYTLLKDIEDSWPIPIHYLTDQGEGMLLMEKRSQFVKSTSQWIKLNYGQKGLYRVKYDSGILRAIGRRIKSGKSAPLDSWGIENDLFSFVRSGRIPVWDYINFVEEYCHGAQYPLNSNIAGHLGWLFAATYGTKLSKHVRKALIGFNKDMLARLGWTQKKGEREINTILRGGIIASLGLAEDPDTVEKAKQMFLSYTKRGKKIDQNIRSAIYSTVAWNLGQKNFDTFARLYKSEKFPEEQRRLLGVWGGFKDAKVLRRALGMTFSDGVRLQDSFILPMRVASNLNGKALAWQWTKKNWQKLMRTYDPATHMLSHFLENFSGMDTIREKNDIKGFFSRKQNMRPDLVQTLGQTLERIDANIRFREKNKI